MPHRLHALDATRAFALLLGIVLHATMSFFLPMPVQDASHSATLGVTFYVIHIFRMSLFFLIAGLFARMLLQSRGPRAFVKDRAKRIVVPMTVGWIVLAPLIIAIFIWGLARTFPGGLPEGMDGAALAAQGLPLTHLWFLYYLCIFYALALLLRAALVVLAGRAAVLRARTDTLVRAALASYLAPVLLAAPLFLVLYLDDGWSPWFGIPTPDTGLLPKWPALVGFGTIFVFGWLLQRQMDLLHMLQRQWPVNLVLAVVLTTLCLGIVGMTPNLVAPTVIQGGAGMRAVYAAAYTIAIGYWTLGLIGAAMRFFARVSPLRRYLADASYWIYLVHLPLVFALQVLMMSWPLHWTLKFSLIIVITLAVSLVSYHYLVRATLIGAALNGRRHPRRQRAQEHEPGPALRREPDDDGGEAVAVLKRVTKRYGETTALNGLDLTVRPGELLAVLGPNGAGKSTALGLWLGTLVPDDGVVRLMGGSPLDVHSRLGVGVMMQEVNLTPTLTAHEHIALVASYYPDPLSVADTIALAGIEAFAGKRHGKLSAGQKRQVQFALAVCGKPRLLFLDEPTAGLDIQAREAMWRAIRGLLADGRAIVLTTHYLEEAEALADRVAVLAGGRLIATGSVADMRALVQRKRISCTSLLESDDIHRWPGVLEVVRDARRLHITALDAEDVVRRLLEADPGLSRLEVRQASLAEAFNQLTGDITQEAA